MPQLLVQKWEESERGWGVRPDGYSLHLNQDDLDAYIAEHFERYRKMFGEVTPDEYDRPSGTPYWWDAPQERYDFVVQHTSHHGWRSFDRQYPGSGGTDGWRNGLPKEWSS